MHAPRVRIGLLAVALTLAAPAAAIDTIWLAGGSGTNGTVGPPHGGQFYKAVVGWDWPERWQRTLGRGWLTDGYWSASVGYGDPDSGNGDERRLRDVGVNGNLRLTRSPHPGRWFVDTGFGLHWVSNTRFERLSISTHHQFALLAALGYQGERWEAAYELYHLSNGGTGSSNPGLNFNLLRIGYRVSGFR